MAFCSDAGRGDELMRRFGRLEIALKDGKPEQPQTKDGNSPSSNLDPSAEKELSILIMSIRKLREGIVASKRVDDFSVQAYIFCIRFSILIKHMESYHPAILHLLKRMHPVQPLSGTELQEFAGYLVLDLACRQNDLAQAYSVRYKYGLHDPKVDSVLQALAHDNYFSFWRVKNSVDGHKASIMEFVEDDVRKQTLKCLGRTYFTMDLHSVEGYTNMVWPLLQKNYAVGWQLEGQKVVIRKPKTR
jgi:hypothetical protein